MRPRLARSSLIDGHASGVLSNSPAPRFNIRMSDTRIDFIAPATLRKWPSLNKQRVSASLGARPYMISEGTLAECIEQFILLPEAQRHLYEIHTAPQSDVVGAILSTEHIVELALEGFFSENSCPFWPELKLIRNTRPVLCGGTDGLILRASPVRYSSEYRGREFH